MVAIHYLRFVLVFLTQTLSLDRILVPAPSIPHFKGFGMRNLQYEIRICQKSHNTVTISVDVWTIWFEF